MRESTQILISDGLRTILASPKECIGCHTMHYHFMMTLDGHRCIDCAKTDPLTTFLQRDGDSV